MRIILILWFIPLFIFWGWYALSAYDLHMGMFFLTRQFHDHLFGIYASILHLPREDVPLAIAGVFAFDSMLVLGIAALRWYKKWLPETAVNAIELRLAPIKTWGVEKLNLLAFWRRSDEEQSVVAFSTSDPRTTKYLQADRVQPAE